MIAREKLPSLSFPAGVSQVDTASREKATIAVIIFFCIISIISTVIFVIVYGKHWYDIILIVILALHCLYCAQRDVSIKETTAQVLLGRVAIFTSAGAAEVLDTDVFTNALWEHFRVSKSLEWSPVFKRPKFQKYPRNPKT